MYAFGAMLTGEAGKKFSVAFKIYLSNRVDSSIDCTVVQIKSQ